jgi:YgiT-type zinc finger domain-containing protein
MRIKIKSCPSCPECGSDRIKLVHRNWRAEYQGHKYSVPDLEYYECPDCGEKVYDREAMPKIETRSPAFPSPQAKKKSA